jgi:MFS family permease
LFLLCVLDADRDKELGQKAVAVAPVMCSDIKYFDSRFWLVSVNMAFVYMSVFTFNNVSSAFLQTRFHIPVATAGFIMVRSTQSITYATSAILGPFIGKWVDLHGHRAQLCEAYVVLLSAVIITASHISFILMPDCSGCYWVIIGFCLLGLGFAIFVSVVWPSVPFTVPEQSTGTAFGVSTSFQNCGLLVGSLYVGAIVDSTTQQNGYFWVNFSLGSCAAVSALVAVALWRVDYKEGNSLNYPEPLLVRRRPSSVSEDTRINPS